MLYFISLYLVIPQLIIYNWLIYSSTIYLLFSEIYYFKHFLVNPTPSRGHLSNLCASPRNPLYFWCLLFINDPPRPVTVFKGRISAPAYRLLGSPMLRQHLLKVCKYIHSCETQDISPLGWHSGGVPWVAVTSVKTPSALSIVPLGGIFARTISSIARVLWMPGVQAYGCQSRGTRWHPLGSSHRNQGTRPGSRAPAVCEVPPETLLLWSQLGEAVKAVATSELGAGRVVPFILSSVLLFVYLSRVIKGTFCVFV